MKTAIIQSNYIPWLGYFNIISSVDKFVFYDTAQYTKRSWRNRNFIKTPNGKFMLTVPVKNKSNQFEKIENIEIADKNWGKKHKKILDYNYKQSKYYKEISNLIYDVYFDEDISYLSQVNSLLIKKISKYLNFETQFYFSSEFYMEKGPTESLLSICKELETNTYVTGPFGKTYLDENLFAKNNIELKFFEYPEYSHYNQLWGEDFISNLSIVDCLFNNGKNTTKYLV